MYTESLPTNNNGSDDIYDDVASTENEQEVSNTVLVLDIPISSDAYSEHLFCLSSIEKCRNAHTVCQRLLCQDCAFIVFR